MKQYLIGIALVILSACQSAPQTQVTKPTSQANLQGFSQARLDRIAPAMQKYIDSGKLSGVATLIARNGEIVYLNAQGKQDREADIALSEDTLFRIYSMTKPVTAVAAMTLWEQGRFHMQDPISMYLPELSDLRVYVKGEGENIKTTEAKSPIRIIDLFTHTAGFSYGFSNSPVDKLYQEMFKRENDLDADGFLNEIAKIPLVNQPGEKWHYGVSTDVLGMLVERLSGKKLGEFMSEVIFKPLGMDDTGFYVEADKLSRLTQIYTSDDNGQTVVMTNPPLGDYRSDPKMHSGGAGLVSSIHDYWKFAQMLLNDGELNGKRILGRKTVEYLRSNHLPADLIPFTSYASGEGYGLAMSVTVDPEQVLFMSSKGNYGWGGMASTYFRIDPVENMVFIGMAQFVPIGMHRYHDDLRNLVYQALVDE